MSTGLGNVFNNGVDGTGFGGTSQAGKHRITLWKSDDGVAWEKWRQAMGATLTMSWLFLKISSIGRATNSFGSCAFGAIQVKNVSSTYVVLLLLHLRFTIYDLHLLLPMTVGMVPYHSTYQRVLVRYQPWYHWYRYLVLLIRKYNIT